MSQPRNDSFLITFMAYKCAIKERDLATIFDDVVLASKHRSSSSYFLFVKFKFKLLRPLYYFSLGSYITSRTLKKKIHKNRQKFWFFFTFFQIPEYRNHVTRYKWPVRRYKYLDKNLDDTTFDSWKKYLNLVVAGSSLLPRHNSVTNFKSQF